MTEHEFRPLIWVDPENLKAHPEYQRRTDRRRAQRMADTFDTRIYDPVTVAVRDGIQWIVDGAHRVLACKILGLEKIPAFQADTLTVQEDARLFGAKQQGTKSLNAREKFRAAVVAGVEDAVEIDRAARDAGWTVGSDLRCIGALRICHRAYGIVPITRALMILSEGLPEDRHPEIVITIGLVTLLATWPEASDDRLVKIIKSQLDRIIRTAETTASLGTGNRGAVCAGVIRDRYNIRLTKGALPERKIIKL